MAMVQKRWYGSCASQGEYTLLLVAYSVLFFKQLDRIAAACR